VDWRPTEAELGKLFDALPLQPLFLAGVLSGEREPSGWWGAGRTADWSDAVELVRAVAAALGVEIRVEAAERMPWHPSRCARVLIGDQEIGHAGELHPRVCTRFGLPRGTAGLEIDLDALMRRAVDVPRAPTYSNQPLAKEDVALVVDDSVSAAEVEAALRAGAGELLESVRLFDVYTGPQIGEGRRSLAFALRELRGHLAAMPSSTGSTRPERLLEHLETALDNIDLASLATPSGPRRPRLQRFFDTTRGQLEQLSDAIADVHFASGPPPQMLSTLSLIELPGTSAP